MNIIEERAAFEKWVSEATKTSQHNLRKNRVLSYSNATMQARWIGWLARAKLEEKL